MRENARETAGSVGKGQKAVCGGGWWDYYAISARQELGDGSEEF